jgi:hypothetical protein
LAGERVGEHRFSQVKLQALSAWSGCRRRRPAPERPSAVVGADRDGGGRPVAHGWARPMVEDDACGHWC